MSDSRQTSFNWNKIGVWAIVNARGLPVFVFGLTTPYECRAEYLRTQFDSWTTCTHAGMYVQEYVPLTVLRLVTS